MSIFDLILAKITMKHKIKHPEKASQQCVQCTLLSTCTEQRPNIESQIISYQLAAPF